MEKHLTELKEEGQQLSKSPTSDPVAMTAAMKKAVDEITKKIQMLTEQQHEFMTLCQQKRDFFIVAIKYHMTVKQVKCHVCVCVSVCVCVCMCVCVSDVCVCHV